MRHPHGETVTRLRAVRVMDLYSKQTTHLDWSDPARHDFRGCAVWPSETVDITTIGRNQMFERLNVALPPGAEVDNQDRLEIRGEVYDVQGTPFVWRNPYTGETPGVMLQAYRRLG